MNNLSIDLATLYRRAIHLFKKYGSFVLGISVTFYVCAIVPQVYYVLNAPAEPTIRWQVISMVLTLLQVFLTLGFIKVCYRLATGQQTGVMDLINNGKPFLSYFVASFLYGIAVVVGIFLLIVPGIYLAIRLQFYPYFILEHDNSSIQALTNSFHITGDYLLELFLFGISVLLINVAGILLFGVGIIFTYPLTTLATALVYRRLVSTEKNE